MISRLTGTVVHVGADTVEIERDGLAFECLIPAATLHELQQAIGESRTLFTFLYLEGNPAGSNLVPRLVGFSSAAERAFFHRFTRVKGVSIRRALRAMSLPVQQLAAAIEHGDARLLTGLPEIGKKTASQIIADLQGQLADFVAPDAAAPAVVGELTSAQRVALDILVQWGDRRADAERWLRAAVEADASLTEPEDMVRAAYQRKLQHAGR